MYNGRKWLYMCIYKVNFSSAVHLLLGTDFYVDTCSVCVHALDITGEAATWQPA